jgi:DNA-binding NtrC family response regulator
MKPPGIQGAPTENISVVSISGSAKDHTSLRQILNQTDASGIAAIRWTVRSSPTVESGLSLVKTERVPLVIADSDLEAGSWKRVLSALNDMRGKPLLIVTSRVADESLWSEVLNHGGWDLLSKPFQADEVIHVLSHAWLHWKHNRKVRNETVGAMAMGAAL